MIKHRVSLKLFTDNHVFDDMTDKQIKILVAAIKIFSEQGYANSSTKEIAEEAGVAEGNIFSKFTNKQGLLNAIIAPVIKSVFPASLSQFSDAKIADQYQTLRDFIHDFVTDRINFMQENSAVIKIVAAEMIYDDKMRQVYVDEMLAASKDYWPVIDANFTLFKRNHLLINWPNLEILRLIWSIVGGLTISYLFFDQPISQSDVNHAIDALTKALDHR